MGRNRPRHHLHPRSRHHTQTPQPADNHAMDLYRLGSHEIRRSDSQRTSCKQQLHLHCSTRLRSHTLHTRTLQATRRPKRYIHHHQRDCLHLHAHAHAHAHGRNLSTTPPRHHRRSHWPRYARHRHHPRLRCPQQPPPC